MLRAARNETSHTNPKRQRGNELKSSLALFDVALFVLCPGGARENSQGLSAPGS